MAVSDALKWLVAMGAAAALLYLLLREEQPTPPPPEEEVRAEITSVTFEEI